MKRIFRAVLPAFLLAVSVGQIYAFTNFSDEIARCIGESQKDVQFAFSLGIFFLGMGAAFFGKIFGPFTSLSTFIWRFLTFYFPIIVGLIMSLFVGKMMGSYEEDSKLTNLSDEDIKGDEV